MESKDYMLLTELLSELAQNLENYGEHNIAAVIYSVCGSIQLDRCKELSKITTQYSMNALLKIIKGQQQNN